MDVLTFIPLTLRDTFRSGLIPFVLGGVVALVAGLLLVFAGLNLWHLADIQPTLWGHVQPGSLPSRVAAVAIWVLTYVLTTLVAVALFLSFVVLPRARAVCLVQYRMLVPVNEGSLLTPLRHAWRQARQMGWVALVLLCVPVLGVVLAPFAAAYFNARSLVLDALEELATDAEVQQVLKSSRLDLMVLGAFTVLWTLIPLLGLTSPLVLTIGVCHVAMRRLARLRGYTL